MADFGSRKAVSPPPTRRSGITGCCSGSACRCGAKLTQDWFRIVLRYGGVGGEEVFLDPDPDDYKIQANIRPTRDGELFIFVNEP